ncbi:LOW QUALITY PROTEIN: hypothetical protein Cgig2_028094 [Carnegiea gigantea]|uniref:Endonuclease/exonuclease/phosphatase domain-containing protein n=1 Tax=Carnegiea gigantea TaxID=171969 RepID=A0A9Q1KJZ3_9CARY|nr:LOW QUALITY PROTEIN: hypothetical protein Cgig2_028094 [Carnegiea gigantea]
MVMRIILRLFFILLLMDTHMDFRILIWNTQGTGSREFLHTLREHLRIQRPMVVALLETHVSGRKTEKICRRIGFSGRFRVETQGFQGGIWLLWMEEKLHLHILDVHAQFITAEFTAIYASPHLSFREVLWNKLEEHASNVNIPWLLAGDFNETRNLDERGHGGHDMAQPCTRFSNWIENNALLDLGFSGPKFTWARAQNPETKKSARLDRALCNLEWRARFPEGGVRHLVRNQSDHAPILVSTKGFTTRPIGPKPFRFQAAWLLHQGFDEEICHAWRYASESALCDLAEHLMVWNEEKFENLFQRRRLLWCRIEGIQNRLAKGGPRYLLKLKRKLRGQLDEDLGMYLGVSTLSQRVNKKTFRYVVERLEKRLAGWRTKCLSLAGRVTLINSTLTTIPTYVMQTCRLPRGTCDEINRKIQRFLWAGTSTERKPHLVAWATVTRPLREGGLGINSMRELNSAYMAKLGWRMVLEPKALWAKVLKQKYCKEGIGYYHFSPGCKPSNAWKGICEVSPILQRAIMLSIGDGRNTLFWSHRWATRRPIIEAGDNLVPTEDQKKLVADYWQPGVGWKWKDFTSFVSREVQEQITSI